MLPFNRVLFWDCDFNSLDFENHRLFIIGRVLTRGQWSDWQALRELCSKESLAADVVQIRDLDPRTLAFCSAYFDIPKEQFRCFTKTPSSSLTPGRF